MGPAPTKKIKIARTPAGIVKPTGMRTRRQHAADVKAGLAQPLKWDDFLLPSRTPGAHIGSTGRAVSDSQAVSAPKFIGKSYKTGTFRLHWKGLRNASGGTSGITPFLTTRSDKRWTKSHDLKRREFSDTLLKGKGFTNPFAKHGAENSHLIAGSLYGPNDVLSAPPASIHQNTEWLAIEEGIKQLMKTSEVRLKATGYVHESGTEQGRLKAARYKIYVHDGTQFNKAFDHVSDGARGNIGKSDVKDLRQQVAGLGTTPLPVWPGNGISGNAPSLSDAKSGHESSIQSKLFTDLKTSVAQVHQGQAALDFANKRY